MDISESVDVVKIKFKKCTKKKSLRKHTHEEEQEEDEGREIEDWKKLDELKESRNLKKSKLKRGVNVDSLKINDDCKLSNLNTNKEGKTKTNKGGLTTKKALASELDLGNTFSVETNRRDEDQDMIKYIEEGLAKNKGVIKDETLSNENKNSDDVLFNVLPDHLIGTNKKGNEEMLSSQMLTGIPELDLGIYEKIRNIEATEEAKNKLVLGPRKGYSSDKTLVPTNIAANYIQNNRYHLNSDSAGVYQIKKPKIEKPATTITKEPVVVIGDEPKSGTFKTRCFNNQSRLKFPGKEKASDDYHFEKFRKQFRK